MTRTLTLVLSCCALLMAAALPAQDYDGQLARMTEWTVDAASVADFEAGLKRHNELHAKHNDPVPLFTWVVATGKDAGKYWRGSLGHRWADFDQAEVEGDAEDLAVNLDPHITAAVPKIWGLDASVSLMDSAPASPAALGQVSEFRLDIGSGRSFRQVMAKVHAAAKEANWPQPYFWYTLISGGASPTLALVVPHDSWADFKEPSPDFGQMLFAALGEEGIGELMTDFTAAVKSERTYVLELRPDLSYIPAAAGDE